VADEIDRFLATFPPDIQALTNQVRALIASLSPDADENLKLGWKVIWYGFGTKMPDQFAVLMPTRNHVGLGFAHGAELPDPAGKLEGVGKRMRHVKLRREAEVADPAVAALLRAQMERSRASGGRADAPRPSRPAKPARPAKPRPAARSRERAKGAKARPPRVSPPRRSPRSTGRKAGRS
jgi:hypothetical protein